MRRRLPPAFATTVAASAAPYGYTITIWSSGMLLTRGHGVPRAAEVFGFLAGALIGFRLTGLLARGALARAESLDDPADRVAAGGMHWLSTGAAVGAVALLARIPGWEAWPLGSFAATAVYIAGAAIELAVVSARSHCPGATTVSPAVVETRRAIQTSRP